MAASVVYSTFGGHVVYENRGGIERTYMRDPLGNTIGLMDMSGNQTDSYTYWPYGEVQNHTGSATTPLTFLGTLGYFADRAGQLYVRARHLRSDLTRWTSIDQLWPRRTPYAYADSMPTVQVDPNGEWPVGPCDLLEYGECFIACWNLGRFVEWCWSFFIGIECLCSAKFMHKVIHA